MHQYDLNIILNPGLNEAQLQTEKDAVVSQLERVEAEVLKVEEWGMRRLAYPIEKHSEGYYLIYTLNLTPEAPKALESSLRLRDNVMRALVIRDRPDWKTRRAKKPAAEPVTAARD
ncbi:MAG: 30S ribosomal protein S6 [Deinococcota bacterium]|jgi:small subunit ribosomal protein S6|nr:30S ribosomal protein S6 [Deinococcota bacterium]